MTKKVTVNIKLFHGGEHMVCKLSRMHKIAITRQVEIWEMISTRYRMSNNIYKIQDVIQYPLNTSWGISTGYWMGNSIIGWELIFTGYCMGNSVY